MFGEGMHAWGVLLLATFELEQWWSSTEHFSNSDLPHFSLSPSQCAPCTLCLHAFLHTPLAAAFVLLRSLTVKARSMRPAPQVQQLGCNAWGLAVVVVVAGGCPPLFCLCAKGVLLGVLGVIVVPRLPARLLGRTGPLGTATYY